MCRLNRGSDIYCNSGDISFTGPDQCRPYCLCNSDYDHCITTSSCRCFCVIWLENYQSSCSSCEKSQSTCLCLRGDADGHDDGFDHRIIGISLFTSIASKATRNYRMDGYIPGRIHSSVLSRVSRNSHRRAYNKKRTRCQPLTASSTTLQCHPITRWHHLDVGNDKKPQTALAASTFLRHGFGYVHLRTDL